MDAADTRSALHPTRTRVPEDEMIAMYVLIECGVVLRSGRLRSAPRARPGVRHPQACTTDARRERLSCG
ncbi:hypothetical protein BJF90_00610 [Pseudonocardia sp. CNS-004]|nr:hypothetical protein BJF90_00610 [Pseudonocardia sp. CNS-004]